MINFFISGGPVMYPLLLCSIVAVAVIIERFIFWSSILKNQKKKLAIEIVNLCIKDQWEKARELSMQSKGLIIKILNKGILHKGHTMTAAMETEASNEIRRMKRFMSVLDTMITIAPLLGIFGTVTGIIASFEALGLGSINHIQGVTAGIAQALITTAAGLCIAIISVIPFNYFNTKIENTIFDIEKYATYIEIAYNKINKD